MQPIDGNAAIDSNSALDGNAAIDTSPALDDNLALNGNTALGRNSVLAEIAGAASPLFPRSTNRPSKQNLQFYTTKWMPLERKIIKAAECIR